MNFDTVASGAVTTLTIWAGALVIGLVVGAPVCAIRMHRWPPVSAVAACVIAVVRGVPPLVWIFLVFFSVTAAGQQLPAVPSATVALGLVGAAYLAEIYRSALENVARGQVEAAAALGIPRMTVLARIRVRQAMPLILAAGGSFAINLLKDTALASLIGAQDLTFLASDEVKRGANGLTVFFLIGLVYLAASVPIGLLVRYMTSRAQLSMGAAR